MAIVNYLCVQVREAITACLIRLKLYVNFMHIDGGFEYVKYKMTSKGIF